jgi:hypothetical protein
MELALDSTAGSAFGLGIKKRHPSLGTRRHGHSTTYSGQEQSSPNTKVSYYGASLRGAWEPQDLGTVLCQVAMVN